MIFSYSLLFCLGLSSTGSSLAWAASSAKDELKPCTIRSPLTHTFIDLNPLHILDPAESKVKHPRQESWNTTGWDLGYNFTMNFCGPVIEDVKHVVGVDKHLWGNVSAYYKHDGEIYSIG